MFYPHPRTIWQPEKQSNSYSVNFKLAITRAFSAARRVSTTSSNSWSSAFLFIVTDTAIQTPDFFANWINDEIPWRLSDYSRNTPALSPHLLSVLSLGGQRADVGPAQLLHNLHHGLGLQPNHCNSDYILHFTSSLVNQHLGAICFHLRLKALQGETFFSVKTPVINRWNIWEINTSQDFSRKLCSKLQILSARVVLPEVNTTTLSFIILQTKLLIFSATKYCRKFPRTLTEKMTQLTAQSSVFIMVTSQLVEALIWCGRKMMTSMTLW